MAPDPGRGARGSLSLSRSQYIGGWRRYKQDDDEAGRDSVPSYYSSMRKLESLAGVCRRLIESI